MGHDGFLRNFEGTIRCLAERGNSVHLAFRARRPHLLDGVITAEALAAEAPSISFDIAPSGRDAERARLTEAAQSGRDFWRYIGPAFVQSRSLSRRAERHAPPRLVRLARTRLAHLSPIRSGVDATLRSLTTDAPLSRELTDYLKALDPAVVLFTPLVGFNSTQYHALRSARALGIPTGLAVHSWDNLTNKGVLHVPVDRVFVWNEAQRREAVEFHGVDPAAVVVTGAQNYDHWFDWQPRLDRGAFCQRVGLEDERPFLLYLCSSKFIAPDERRFVEAWVKRLRESSSERLQSTGIVIRPHPQHLEQWEGLEAVEPGRAVIWPREHNNPVDRDSRSDYYDSLHFAGAVVGVNTSALIEAAIVGRRTFSWLTADYRDSQGGAVHFQHLAGSDQGGVLELATTFSQHVAQLDLALEADPGSACNRADAFLESFVRPHGLDRAVTPILAEAIEETRHADTGSRSWLRVPANLERPIGRALLTSEMGP